MSSSRILPDLRNNHDITLEHCSVLLEKVSQALRTMDGADEDSLEFSDVNPELLRHQFEEYLKPQVFTHLFNTDFGKNILVGMFLQTLLEKMAEEE